MGLHDNKAKLQSIYNTLDNVTVKGQQNMALLLGSMNMVAGMIKEIEIEIENKKTTKQENQLKEGK